MAPKVSVIIPNYNHAKFLQQRIDSILAQSYQDFELIILDDCSTDNSVSLINQYKENKKITNIIINEKNSGSTFKQWEKGIKIAIGEYIWIAESDDWCEPTLLAELMDGLLANNKCVVGFCQSICTNGSKIMTISKFDNLYQYMNGGEFVNNHLIKKNSIFNASMAVWKKSTVYTISSNYTTFKFCGDWLFWVEMCLKGEVFISGKVLNYFRKHNLDVSGKFYKSGNNFLEEIRVFDNLLNMELISGKAYAIALREQYWRFHSVKSTINYEIRYTIQNEFFKNKKFNKYIQYNEQSIMNKVIRKGIDLFNKK